MGYALGVNEATICSAANTRGVGKDPGAGSAKQYERIHSKLSSFSRPARRDY